MPCAARPASEPCSCSRCRCSTCGPASRSVRAARRASHSSSGRSSTIATTGSEQRRASAISGARAPACTLVASTTVNRPRSSRFATSRCSTWNAASVADWSFSSSDTSARHASDDTISVVRKCCRARVDFPLLVGPISRTREGSGMDRRMERARVADGRTRGEPGSCPRRRRTSAHAVAQRDDAPDSVSRGRREARIESVAPGAQVRPVGIESSASAPERGA